MIKQRTFEEWIRNNPRPTLIFLSHLTIQQLKVLEATCRTLAQVVAAYERLAWSSELFLAHWVSNPCLFVILMELTGAIVGGVQMLSFAERDTIHPRVPLDVFIRIGAVDPFREYLLDSGFTVAFPCPSGLLPMSLRYLAAMPPIPSPTIIEEFHFYKRDPRGTSESNIQAIRVIVVNVDPVEYITTSQPSTAVMNFMTSTQFVSLYPRATLVLRRNYLNHIHPMSTLHLATAALSDFPVTATRLYRPTSYQADGIDSGPRFVGDSRCFLMKVTCNDVGHRNRRRPSVTKVCASPYDNPLVHGRMILLQLLDRPYVICDFHTHAEESQLLSVRDIRQGTRFLAKVIRRPLADPDVLAEDLRAFRRLREANRHFSTVQGLFDINHDLWYVFEDEGIRLARVIDDDDIAPFSPRQVKEIVLQIIDGLQFLHDRTLIHGDLCPESILISDATTVDEDWYDGREGTFYSQAMMKNTGIKLVFHGRTSRRTIGEEGHDRFRSPEDIAGLRLTTKSDYFSLGCVMAELIMQRPLLQDVDPKASKLYERDRFLMMERAIRPFTREFIALLDEGTPAAGAFSSWTDVLVDHELGDEVNNFVMNATLLEDLISDTQVNLVLGALTQYVPANRPDFYVLKRHYPYFEE
ncbi:kinase-like domain-containing protein [Coprinopsis sp. MPI-PUGE-AT-0042]|nr:kinase-like domain-containing protein [Coprinopsis sp. MPI-PUGE-AT-0042]